ncbi:putative mitochondrial ribosomal protein [Talaromyces proteolyticus]|uniref:Mitochondrial ribosomal protein n=1 Tax=Talaromyces proteolyticus TaxID=1131652 RepID=A0AAD4L1P4_9EURO|nr:putative mitochondrial ribosomal protein [Talaromyces proteolyticus]KAH8702240.1 putative mitochondrial ribosomal protein [Talaromyces proteolyticus]
MAAHVPALRPLASLRPSSKLLCRPQTAMLTVTTKWTPRPKPKPFPEELPQQFWSQLPERFRPQEKKEMKIFPPPPSKANICSEPVAAIANAQLAVLDPTGDRMALFDYRRSARSVKPGDIIRVTFKSGDPFSGVVLAIRSRGVDTSVLLRNQLTRVGVEMSIKVFSPNVEGVEIVQRTEKRKRRARLYYMRQPKHDMGSVENIVKNYLRQKSAMAGRA